MWTAIFKRPLCVLFCVCVCVCVHMRMCAQSVMYITVCVHVCIQVHVNMCVHGCASHYMSIAISVRMKNNLQ